jgi:hypothetical protein
MQLRPLLPAQFSVPHLLTHRIRKSFLSLSARFFVDFHEAPALEFRDINSTPQCRLSCRNDPCNYPSMVQSSGSIVRALRSCVGLSSSHYGRELVGLIRMFYQTFPHLPDFPRRFRQFSLRSLDTQPREGETVSIATCSEEAISSC